MVVNKQSDKLISSLTPLNIQIFTSTNYTLAVRRFSWIYLENSIGNEAIQARIAACKTLQIDLQELYQQLEQLEMWPGNVLEHRQSILIFIRGINEHVNKPARYDWVRQGIEQVVQHFCEQFEIEVFRAKFLEVPVGQQR